VCVCVCVCLKSPTDPLKRPINSLKSQTNPQQKPASISLKSGTRDSDDHEGNTLIMAVWNSRRDTRPSPFMSMTWSHTHTHTHTHTKTHTHTHTHVHAHTHMKNPHLSCLWRSQILEGRMSLLEFQTAMSRVFLTSRRDTCHVSYREESHMSHISFMNESNSRRDTQPVTIHVHHLITNTPCRSE